MAQDIYVIDDDESSIPIFKELFRNDKEFKFIGVKTEQIDITLKNIPFLIIINEDSIDRDITGLCKQIRTDEDNQITPIIVVSSNTDKYPVNFPKSLFITNSIKPVSHNNPHNSHIKIQ